MAVKTAAPAATSSYIALVKKFPLVCIRDGKHLKAATEVIHRLLQEELDHGAQDYLDTLTSLVIAYEDEHVPIGDASDVDVLRELMTANGLSQNELAKKVRIAQSTISDILKGRRKLNRDQIVKLAEFFNISPAAFLPKRSTTGSWSSGGTATGGAVGHKIAAAGHA
jgi:HTH-type transcriptional regulator/antitoxin HigA